MAGVNLSVMGRSGGVGELPDNWPNNTFSGSQGQADGSKQVQYLAVCRLSAVVIQDGYARLSWVDLRYFS